MFPMVFSKLSPFRELARLHDEVNRVFDDGDISAYTRYPAMNAQADEKEAQVTLEVPGVDPDKLDISVEDRTLTVKGDFPAYEKQETNSLYRCERVSGAFSRSITLPFKVDAEKVSATCEHGVLKVVLPRIEQELPRRITVHPTIES